MLRTRPVVFGCAGEELRRAQHDGHRLHVHLLGRSEGPMAGVGFGYAIAAGTEERVVRLRVSSGAAECQQYRYREAVAVRNTWTVRRRRLHSLTNNAAPACDMTGPWVSYPPTAPTSRVDTDSLLRRWLGKPDHLEPDPGVPRTEKTQLASGGSGDVNHT